MGQSALALSRSDFLYRYPWDPPNPCGPGNRVLRTANVCVGCRLMDRVVRATAYMMQTTADVVHLACRPLLSETIPVAPGGC